MRNIILSTIAIFLFTFVTQAQNSYQWDEYGLGFEVTEDFSVTESNEEEFSAVSSDGLIEFSLYPWTDASVEEEDLEGHLLEFVVEMASDVDIDDLDADNVEFDDFVGSYVIINVESTMILTAFLLDTESSTNVIAQVTFEVGNEDEAIEILSSLYTYD